VNRTKIAGGTGEGVAPEVQLDGTGESVHVGVRDLSVCWRWSKGGVVCGKVKLGVLAYVDICWEGDPG
jgi:hypothetical protein